MSTKPSMNNTEPSTEGDTSIESGSDDDELEGHTSASDESKSTTSSESSAGSYDY